MSIKQKAFLYTLGIVAGLIIILLGINLIITYFSSYSLLMAGRAALTGFILYAIYSMVLSRLECKETTENLARTIEV